MERFITNIHNRDVFIYKDPFKTITPKNFTVEWGAEIEMRSWGIKEIDTMIYSVKGMLEIEDKAGNFTGLEFNSKGWKILNELKVENDYLCPVDIGIDYKKKTIEVS